MRCEELEVLTAALALPAVTPEREIFSAETSRIFCVALVTRFERAGFYGRIFEWTISTRRASAGSSSSSSREILVHPHDVKYPRNCTHFVQFSRNRIRLRRAGGGEIRREENLSRAGNARYAL